MSQLDFTRDAIDGWARLMPGERIDSLAPTLRLIWAGRLAERALDEIARSVGFRKRGDYEVLSLLRRSEPQRLTQAEVAEKLLLSTSGMTGKIDRLERAGLLERQSDANDRRVVRLGLTDAGREAVDEAFRLGLRASELALDVLEPAEIEQLGDILSRVLGRLDAITLTRIRSL